MVEKTPVERAADALSNRSIYDTLMTHSRKILTAAVEDQDGLVKVLRKHAPEIWSLGDVECACGEFEARINWKAGETSMHRSRNLDAHRIHVAEAVVRWLTGNPDA